MRQGAIYWAKNKPFRFGNLVQVSSKMIGYIGYLLFVSGFDDCQGVLLPGFYLANWFFLGGNRKSRRNS